MVDKFKGDFPNISKCSTELRADARGVSNWSAWRTAFLYSAAGLRLAVRELKDNKKRDFNAEYKEIQDKHERGEVENENSLDYETLATATKRL
jgi:hypothetical protein